MQTKEKPNSWRHSAVLTLLKIKNKSLARAYLKKAGIAFSLFASAAAISSTVLHFTASDEIAIAAGCFLGLTAVVGSARDLQTSLIHNKLANANDENVEKLLKKYEDCQIPSVQTSYKALKNELYYQDREI